MRISDFPADDLFRHFVKITPSDPLANRQIMILLQCVRISAPHGRGGMVAPARTIRGNRPEKLHRLQALFAQPPGIENPQGFGKVRIGQKRLHDKFLHYLENVFISFLIFQR